jgi:hypothetical protein
MRRALLYMLDRALVAACAVVVTLLILAPHLTPPPAHECALTIKTPVRVWWETPEGVRLESMGETVTPLWRMFRQQQDATTRLDTRVSDIETLIHYIVTDPTMRGHLLRHNVTAEQLDLIARTIPDGGRQ